MCTKAVEEESEKEDEMISAVKMGCNKCIAVFYSQGTYHDHLSKRHRIKNFDKYPPTIISKLWKKIPAIPTISKEEQAKRPFHCSACTSKFFTSDALDTHENLCYKATIEVKESQAKIMYECLAKEEEEKGDGEKKDNDGVQRESRSRIPKKKETASRKERVKGSKSKSEEHRSRVNPVKAMYLRLMQIFLKVKRNLKFLTKKMLIRINLSRGRKILNQRRNLK